jgi:rRNA maturation endonuclease Nob1
MKYRIICDTCEVESVVHLVYDEPPNHCPYCGSEVTDDEISEYDAGCLCD